MMTSNEPKIRHEWFQSETQVTLDVYIKKVDPATLSVELNSKSVSLNIALPTGSSIVMDFDPLCHDIDVASSSYEILSTKIEFHLQKANPGLKWSTLEGSHQGPETTMSHIVDAPPAYPSSSKTKHNWSAIDKMEDDKPEGEAALNNLFQTIFKDGSEETKRAMMKSYVESNGTCLSTNWEDIGKKKTEVSPPEGMIAKKYEL